MSGNRPVAIQLGGDAILRQQPICFGVRFFDDATDFRVDQFRSRFAVVAMIVVVVVLQLFAWFVARSPAGTLVSIVVVAFLLRGARRMFQDYAEQKLEGEKV